MSASEAVVLAAQILRKGGLVAFPTETVYGLGADAENESSIRRLFEVKGRPERHPVIVHIGIDTEISAWAAEIPDDATRLAKKFWPGPLTLILRKTPRIPDSVTGGQATVGLRVPGHPLALALLAEFGGAIAAPSANRFGKVSPTTADHVRSDLGSDVDVILDGGPCSVGVESTIVDLSSGTPSILRPGGIPREQLEQCLGHRVTISAGGPVRVSGQLESHYAPRATVVIAEPEAASSVAEGWRAKGKRVVELRAADVEARELYASLRRVDEGGAEIIVVPLPKEEGLGLAVADRLRKAAGKRGD